MVNKKFNTNFLKKENTWTSIGFILLAIGLLYTFDGNLLLTIAAIILLASSGIWLVRKLFRW